MDFIPILNLLLLSIILYQIRVKKKIIFESKENASGLKNRTPLIHHNCETTTAPFFEIGKPLNKTKRNKDLCLQQYSALKKEGLTFSEICKKLNVPKSTLHGWLKKTQN